MYTPLPAALAGEVQTRPITIDRSLFFLVTGALVYLTEQEPLEPTGTLTVDAAKAALSAMLDVYLEGEIVGAQFQVDGCDLQVSYDSGETWETLIDLSTCTTAGEDGTDGTNGREIELQTSATHIQWRYVGDVAWTNLVSLASITGATGSTGATGPAGPKIVGTILINASSSVPSGCLACDGTTYLKATYPDLWNALGATWQVDSTHFKVPDLRDRAPIGIGTSPGAGFTARSMGDTIGEETHLLTLGEIAAHTHLVSTNQATGGSTTAPQRTTTGSNPSGIATGNGGGGGAHNNMQPSLAVGFCIVASA